MKKENLELKIYEFLGVKQFRKLVFLLEKIIHHKDKGKNINYHVKGLTVDELENFKKYLYYNGFIHVKNSIFVSLTIIAVLLFFDKLLLIYLIPSLIKNIYCVMLQRYNYIRISQRVQKKEQIILKNNINKREEFKESECYKNLELSNKENIVEELNKLKKFLSGEEDAIFDNLSIEALTLLKEYLETIKRRNNEIVNFESNFNYEDTNKTEEVLVRNRKKVKYE